VASKLIPFWDGRKRKEDVNDDEVMTCPSAALILAYFKFLNDRASSAVCLELRVVSPGPAFEPGLAPPHSMCLTHGQDERS
jgi:hypothetical protein